MNEPTATTIPSVVDNEISLIDLLHLLLASWRLLLASAILLAGLAGTMAALIPRSYTYQTTIEIGRSGDQILESPDSVATKLLQAYFPVVARTIPSARDLTLDVNVPKNSNLVLMSSRGPLEDHTLHLNLHGQVFDRLAQEHGRQMQVLRRAQENEESGLRRRLDDLREQIANLAKRKALVEDSGKLITKRADELRTMLEYATRTRETAAQSASKPVEAMTLLLQDNEISQARTRLLGYEERLTRGFPEELTGIAKEQSDTQRRILETEDAIGQVRLRIANLQETRKVVDTQRSIKPNGIGPVGITVIAAIVGVFLGMLLALIRSGLRTRKIQGIHA